MATLFISDLHIDDHTPAICEQFEALLSAHAAVADALYILGDFFESWIGDDVPDAAQRQATAAIKALTAGGVPCFVMHGNRDFLIGAGFCAASGAQLLSDPVVLTLYGQRILVMHGDALCTDDRAYQQLRATVRNVGWQRRFLGLSAAARQTIAEAARSGSQEHTAALDYAIADVTQESVAQVLRAAGVSTLLHGHTHRPGIHEFELDGQPCRRIVLGDWHAQGSMLRWDETGPRLEILRR